MRHPPKFWNRPASHPGLWSRLLGPLATLAANAARRRSLQANSAKVSVPVISIGNLVVGGQGKTPLAIGLAEFLFSCGWSAHLITRGYGGRATGPHRVDPERDSYRRVGDEALLLAQVAPTWVAGDRAAAAKLAVESGAEVIILDDAHQNFSLAKDFSLVAVDAGYGFGNERVLPAGPLRERASDGLDRADCIVLTGKGDFVPVTDLPVLRTRLKTPPTGLSLMGTRVLAFAGIARPERFYRTLREGGAQVIRTVSFPDHHPYRPLTLQRLLRDALTNNCVAVTTEKDMVRIPPAFRESVVMQKISLTFVDEEALSNLLAPILGGGLISPKPPPPSPAS